MNTQPEVESRIGIFSFFSGAGFLDLGFEQSELFETVFVNEFHEPFMEIYKHARNQLGIAPPKYGHHVCDISNFLSGSAKENFEHSLNAAKLNFDLVGFIGGPPCPDFSVAGKNRGIEGENGKLSGTYVDLITSNKPDFFLFENVKGLYRTKKHREFFESIKRKLSRHGYVLTEKLINAIEYGAPQDRERIILVGFKSDLMSAPKKHIKNFDWSSSTSYLASDVLAMNWPKQEPFKIESEKNCPKGILPELTVEHWFRKNDVTNHPNSNHFFQPRAGLPKFLSIEEGDDLKKSYKRLHRWRYSPTAAYGNNEVHVHPYMARRISAAEALAIQSLPKEFVLTPNATLTNMFKSIGNGVPYKAAKGLAKSISTFIGTLETQSVLYEKING